MVFSSVRIQICLSIYGIIVVCCFDTALCAGECVFVGMLFFLFFFPSKQTSPVLLFISSTRCRISLQQNGRRGSGGRRETDSHAQADAPPILLWLDAGWQQNSFPWRFCAWERKTGSGNEPLHSALHRIKDMYTCHLSLFSSLASVAVKLAMLQ